MIRLHKRLAVIIYALGLVWIIYIIHTLVPSRQGVRWDSLVQYCQGPTCKKDVKILLWTKFFSDPFSVVFSYKHEPPCKFKCSFIDRGETTSEADLRRSLQVDAVAFHLRNFDSGDVPPLRDFRQIYVAANLESNYNVDRDKIPRGFFNSTLDFFRNNISYTWNYGEMREPQTNEEGTRLMPLTDEEFDDIYSKKERIAISMISNCQSNSDRAVYIRKLSLSVSVTNMGFCWIGPATRRVRCNSGDSCEQELLDSHFFLLAFENGVCKDYVTEKFFRLTHNIVPIVLRRSILEGWAPPSSFIAADDFASPDHLAEHLKRVSSDPNEYRKYFAWRETHFIERHQGYCDLCRYSTVKGGICCRDLHFGNVTVWRDLDPQSYYSQEQCQGSIGSILAGETWLDRIMDIFMPR